MPINTKQLLRAQSAIDSLNNYFRSGSILSGLSESDMAYASLCFDEIRSLITDIAEQIDKGDMYISTKEGIKKWE